ncbi:uncharacterized protein MKZ38_006760 [Zalerion maritima]|uniref:Transcription factor domain-containing protein n=1 Tax=Zalerion maritima TaxID=339359 RepID=A0AAD5RIN1_9PEZI|nr:uncharacterized protein MKZ38_006760 [Zalerion maritima]
MGNATRGNAGQNNEFYLHTHAEVLKGGNPVLATSNYKIIGPHACKEVGIIAEKGVDPGQSGTVSRKRNLSVLDITHAVPAKAPILSCSIFPGSGQPGNDREFRHPRAKANKSATRDPAKVRREILDAPVKAADEWDGLPPLGEIIDCISNYRPSSSYLGFIPTQQIIERLRSNHHSVSVFLVVGILSIYAPLTPLCIKRYGSGVEAAKFFVRQAARLASSEMYQDPTLERCQALYLLGVAQQDIGQRNESFASLTYSRNMRCTERRRTTTRTLHLRASWELPESARRTLWALYCQGQLHTSPSLPVPLSDITVLLPSDEHEFASGREPLSRAALEGTMPALENSALIHDPNRSLFASLVQARQFWYTISRHAVTRRNSRHGLTSEFVCLINCLRDWERCLPLAHLLSSLNFERYKASGQDRAYISVTMIPRLCKIVLGRPYLSE